MIPLWVHNFLETLIFLLTLAFVSSILRAKRAPGSAVAWLLVIVVIPYIGIPLYLLFSGRKFKTRFSRKLKINRPTTQLKEMSRLSTTQRILSASGESEARFNKRIQLLPTGTDAYSKLIELIVGAKKSISITTFVFGNDAVGIAIVDALAKRAAEGIDVRVLVDSLGATLIRHPSFDKLKRAGGRTAYFMPLLRLPFRGRFNLRNHRKLMIVDNQFAILGGMNLAEEYLGPTTDPNRWIDLALYLEGRCVADLAEIFYQDWAWSNNEKLLISEPGLSDSDRGNVLAQVVASGPDVIGDPLYDILLNAIHTAKNHVWIVTPYFIPDEILTKALELAVKRGVLVNIIIPKKSNHFLADLARGSFVRQLRDAGVQFKFYEKMIHAKIFLVDHELAILGSANLDMRSLLLNYELGLVIYNQEVLQEVKQWIFKIENETTSVLKKSSFLRELAEGIGRIIGPIL